MAGRNAPPDFKERLENKATRQGEAISLSAVVTGSPNPVVRWFREGTFHMTHCNSLNMTDSI